ncbi:hypothetical protein O6H91_10G052800 [Diphasiastrum complanatum]|uniref:Uncharacterized protein n=2 Tax=Diphasiastrum complanatum TaxID=34168 RepID=A0ACC2CH10_DIPCM|nr:hypothetical protein O6H91_10G052800 [Diphasiastrum complanatum]
MQICESCVTMEPYEATRIVYSRVQSMDPENVSKIMGCFLLQDNGEEEMFRLARGSDLLLHSMVLKAKKELGLSSRGGLRLPNELSYLQIPPQLSNGGHFSPQISNQLSPQLPHQSPRYSAQSVNQLSPHFHIQTQNQRAFHAVDRFHNSTINRRDDQHYSGHDIAALHELPLHMKLASRLKEKQVYSDQLPLQDFLPSMNDAVEMHSSVGGVFPNDHFYPETLAFLNNSKITADRVIEQHPADDLLSPDLSSTLAWKPCLYFARGYCKHGNNCRFLHGPSKVDSSGSSSPSNGQWEMQGDEWLGVPGSLERLELELQELLRGRRSPVSIASLPQLYYERFGKTLQAEGYLTESQRHGKAGYSLTKLLARLRTTVSLIDSRLDDFNHDAWIFRPHGQHAVVLAEDAHKFTLYRSNSEDLNGVNPSSRQIYLTFPAESTFTEEDVSTHFRAYGPVQDVRIPYQQKRMFGFVTFVYSETVKTILSEGNPHYICGARVLVKPYREKGKHGDKKPNERGYPLSQNIPGKNFDISAQKFTSENDLFSMQLNEESLMELERRRLTEMHIADMRRRRVEAEMANLASAAQANQNHLSSDGLPADDLPISAEEIRHLRSNSTFGFLFDVLDSETNDNAQNEESFSSGKESHMLPNNPFSNPLGIGKEVAFSLPDIGHLSLGEKLDISGIATSALGASNHVHHDLKYADIGNNQRQVHNLVTSSYEEQDKQSNEVDV